MYIQCPSIFGFKTLYNSLLPNSVGTTYGNVQQMNYIWTKAISTWTMCSLLIDIHSNLSWKEVYAFMTAQKNSFEIIHLISNWKNRYVWLTNQAPYLIFINTKKVCINCCWSCPSTIGELLSKYMANSFKTLSSIKLKIVNSIKLTRSVLFKHQAHFLGFLMHILSYGLATSLSTFYSLQNLPSVSQLSVPILNWQINTQQG